MTLCAQQRLKSAWASPQTDQTFCCPHEETLCLYLPNECTTETPNWLSGCPGWSESSLGSPVYCFCHVLAQIINISEVHYGFCFSLLVAYFDQISGWFDQIWRLGYIPHPRQCKNVQVYHSDTKYLDRHVWANIIDPDRTALLLQQSDQLSFGHATLK